MQPGQQGGLALDPPGREGALQDLQRHRPSTPTGGPNVTARGADTGAVRCWVGREKGDQERVEALRK
jgi:hypothetical protein